MRSASVRAAYSLCGIINLLHINYNAAFGGDAVWWLPTAAVGGAVREDAARRRQCAI